MGDLNRVINSRSSLPVLGAVHVSMDATGRLVLTTMDGNDYVMHKTLQADRWEGQGKFIVESCLITNALKGLSEQDIIITCDNNAEPASIRVAYTGGSLGFLAGDLNDWPVEPRLQNPVASVILSGKILREGVSRVIYATAREDLRLLMTGVHFRREGDTLVFAGSDGRLLCMSERRANFLANSSDEDFSATLPGKLGSIICSCVSDGNQVKVSLSDERIRLEFGNTTIDACLIEGRYPNFRAVIPTDCTFHVQADRKTLLACVRRVALFADGSSQLIKLHYADGILQVSGADTDLFARTMTEDVPDIKAWSDTEDSIEGLSIGVSAKFFADTLANFGSEVVDMQIVNPSRPIVFKGDNATSLCMPMVLDGTPLADNAGDEGMAEEEDMTEAA